MPAKFDRCINAVIRSGKSKDSAYAICTASIKPGKKSGKKK